MNDGEVGVGRIVLVVVRDAPRRQRKRSVHAKKQWQMENHPEIGTKKILREILYQAYVLLVANNFGQKYILYTFQNC